MRKTITRLFFGGYDLRLGLQSWYPIHRSAPYILILLFIIGYKAITEATVLDLWDTGLTTKVAIILLCTVFYILTLHFWFFPAKWEHMSDYQKWQFGNGVHKGETKASMTKEQEEQWKILDDYANNRN